MPSGRRKCRGGCGLWLSDPESLARGYGKRCAERLGIPTGSPSKPARASPPTAAPGPPMEGQTEIDLVPFQPTLESL